MSVSTPLLPAAPPTVPPASTTPPVAVPVAVPVTGAAPAAVAPPRSVLLVDDTEMLRRLVARHLDATGRYRVTGQAGTGIEALQLARAVRPDVVLLDLQMDEMDGMTALPLLRAMLPTSRIVIFTGHDHRMLWPALQTAGADAAVGKGTRLRTLVEHLDKLG